MKRRDFLRAITGSVPLSLLPILPNEQAKTDDDVTIICHEKEGYFERRTLYWVGGHSNDWNDHCNWSRHDRGKGGDGPPDENTDVFFLPRAGETFRIGSKVRPRVAKTLTFGGKGTLDLSDMDGWILAHRVYVRNEGPLIYLS